MNDDFGQYPKSVAEIRSDQSENAADWSPRDALIATLRDIDNGVIDPDILVVAYAEDDDQPGVMTPGIRSSSPDPLRTLGMIAWVTKHMTGPAE